MRLIFKKIVIHNFMSFGDESFEFESFKGMTRIKGKNFDIPNQLNGSGKSNLANALVYGLYGELPFKLKNENICNRYLKDKNTSVTVLFTVSNKDYKIISGMRGKQSYCELFEINEDKSENNITRSSMAETRKFLERDILHCDMNLFMRTIYLNSDADYNFYNLKQADKKEFIDKLFDISIFGEMYAAIHKDVLRLEKDIAAHQNRLIILNKNSSEYKTKSVEFENNSKVKVDEISKKITDFTDKLKKAKESASKKNVEIEKKFTDAISKLEKAITEIDSNVRNVKIDISGIDQTISRYKTLISDRQKIINKHSELHSKLCNDCKPIFSGYYNLDKYQKEIDTINTKIETEETKKNSLLEKINSNSEKRTDYNDKLKKLKTKLNEVTSEYNREQENIRNLELSINSFEVQLNNLKTQTNPYTDLDNDNESKIKEETEELSKINDNYKYVRKSQDMVDQENLKKFIIRDLIGLLNNKIKFYLHKLGANYDIIFDEDMKYDFVTSAKSGVEYNNFSLGEKARISVATCFAFRDFLSTRSRITSNILILDEFFDSNVDPLAIDNTMDILKSFVKNNKQKIFIVSHRLEVSDDIFNHIIQVEKKDNISKINYLS